MISYDKSHMIYLIPH